MRVAPFMGAWIETDRLRLNHPPRLVAPFMGAWIETCVGQSVYPHLLVAPFMGAWIETEVFRDAVRRAAGRALHGRVD